MVGQGRAGTESDSPRRRFRRGFETDVCVFQAVWPSFVIQTFELQRKRQALLIAQIQWNVGFEHSAAHLKGSLCTRRNPRAPSTDLLESSRTRRGRLEPLDGVFFEREHRSKSLPRPPPPPPPQAVRSMQGKLQQFHSVYLIRTLDAWICFFLIFLAFWCFAQHSRAHPILSSSISCSYPHPILQGLRGRW